MLTGSTQVKSAVVMSAGQSSGRAIDRGRSRRKRLKRRGQPFCLRATLANFSTFCQQTSLHGWQYIAQKNSSSAKHMFWAVVVSMSMATAALFLYNNTMDYLNATVRANFYLKNRVKLFFPAFNVNETVFFLILASVYAFQLHPILHILPFIPISLSVLKSCTQIKSFAHLEILWLSSSSFQC